jgi:maltoporin
MRRLALAAVLLVAGQAAAQPQDPASPPEPASPEPAPPEHDATKDTAPDTTPPSPPARSARRVNDLRDDPVIRDGSWGAEELHFGSYGRIVAGSDLRGGKPEKVLIVAHGPRVVEDSYLELEFAYSFIRHERHQETYVIMRPVVTLAFDGTLFHDTGEFDAHPALRNAYLDATTGFGKAWVGSRMYRGDDIYLFDYWPLDDQNIVGGGVELTLPVNYRGSAVGNDETHDQISVAAAVGVNRLNHPFQFQTIEVPNPVQGATTVEQLNRQRIVASATAQYVVKPVWDDIGWKAKLHGEVHTLPSGSRKRDDGTFEALPADHGFLVGAELGAFGMSDNAAFRRHLNLFARYAKGLAAFDELAAPTSFGPELKTTKASELTLGLSGNFDADWGNVMLGALSRRFIDADVSSNDPDDGWEYAIAARPLARFAADWFAGADVSYQARFPKGLNPITLRAEDPAVFQIAPMVVFSPMGPSAYDRPQIRLVYRAAHLNGAALDTYVPDDPRHRHEWVQFLGLQAEWWFNSSTYH